ncbi:MAG: hypothetical protein U5J95_03090 [Balneolaceae bacterium]|nr:hypothetical protein [Balneolaceae bacterium]
MRVLINCVLILSVLFVYSCKDNSSGPGSETKTEVTGKVQAPDNSTPIQGATVYTGESLPDDFSASGNCVEPPVDYDAYTCTDSRRRF